MEGREKTQETMYASPEQAEIWKKDAERLDLSKSEFYRQMIQAGRREFGLSEEYNSNSSDEDVDVPVSDLEARIRTAIKEEDGPAPFDEIVDHVVEKGIGKEVDQYLRNAPDIEYSSYEGGYFFTDN